MKRNIVIGLLLIAMSTLTGCGEQENTSENTQVETTEETSEDENETEVDGEDTSTETQHPEVLTDEYLLSLPDSPEEDFSIRTSGEGVAVAEYLGDDEIVVIPETIDGEVVTAIRHAFANDFPVRAVVLPDTVVEINDGAFGNNSIIEKVILGNSLKLIGEISFFDTPNLTEITLPDGLETIERSAFLRSGVAVIDVPSSVVVIEDGALDAHDDSKLLIGDAGSIVEEYAEEYSVPFQAR